MIEWRRVLLACAVGVCGISIALALVDDEPHTALAPLRVEILNGCGEDQLGARVANRLRALGQDVRTVANAPPPEQPRTVLIDRRGRARLTRRLAQALGGVPVLLERVEKPTVDATLLLGADYQRFELSAGQP